MTKKTKPFGYTIALFALIGFAACVVWADDENIPFIPSPGGSGSGCPGPYTGYAKMTNSSGSIWITPPANTSSGTLTDASGFPSPYGSIAYVLRESDGMTWCESNSVTFPATNSNNYQLIVFVTSTPPPPTNGEPLTLQITWH